MNIDKLYYTAERNKIPYVEEVLKLLEVKERQPDSSTLYDEKVVRILGKALPNWLSEEECIALTQILVVYTLETEASFVINGDLETADNQTISIPHAAGIACCFSEDADLDWCDMRHLYWEHISEPKYDGIMNALLETLGKAGIKRCN